MPNIQTSIIEHALDGHTILIERFERRLPVARIEYTAPENPGCEACHKFGRNLACPPYSPALFYHIGDSAVATVIGYRVHLEQLPHEADRHRMAHRLLKIMLDSELLAFKKQGAIVAGAGTCHVCENCAIESGSKQCKFPDKRIFSLESMGINLISLARDAFELTLDWSDGTCPEGTVMAIGAVFSRD